MRELEGIARDPESPFEGERCYRSVGHLRGRVPGPARPTTTRPGSAPRRDGRVRHEVERRAAARPAVVILGSGPNRIGQGIEFDYCCVHAAMTVRETGRDMCS